MEKRPKMKKTLYIARLCRVFGCQSIENTAKTSVLDWRYSKKRVNYRMLDWKHYKNTVKSNVLEGFTAFISPQNQDRLRLSQHWWWKFRMLICNPYNYIKLYGVPLWRKVNNIRVNVLFTQIKLTTKNAVADVSKKRTQVHNTRTLYWFPFCFQ